ncbi:MAG: WYL domain-containing protein [Actinomycetota bacterium]|nr:WYL domain-containing protein [Actinomycetota bacterium]
MIAHPGVTVDELARKFGVRKRDLLGDLNLVFMCGLPGYGPGDLIDVTFDDDRVYVRMADYFAAPLKLTPAEALSLYVGGRAIAGVAGTTQGDALDRALTKLGRALGESAPQRAGVDVAASGGPSQHIAILTRALDEKKAVELEYFSASRGASTTRTVEPWTLYSALGRWYLVGLDRLSDEERMFRVDRIQSVTVTDLPAEPPEDLDLTRYERAFRDSTDAPVMTLEISPGAAGWFSDYYPTRSEKALEDGWVQIELPYSGTRWAAVLLLVLGADARNASDEDVVKEARRIATALARAHGQPAA